MTATTVRKPGMLVILLVIAMAAWSQGLYWESNTVAMGKTIATKTSYMPGKMRMENEKEFTILRLDQEKMYMVYPEKKSYREMTFAELEAQIKGAGARLNKQMAKMQEKMKDMPEEQRKMMEKMMGQSMMGTGKEAKIDVKTTAETKSLLGRICTKYVVESDGKQVAAVWAMKDAKEFSAMRKDMEVYAKRFLALQGAAGKGIGEGMNKIGGFPMEMDMGSGIITTVTKIEPRAVPGSAFEVPAGYTKETKKLIEEPTDVEKE